MEVIEGASVQSYCSADGTLTAVRLVSVLGECVTVPCQVRGEEYVHVACMDDSWSRHTMPFHYFLRSLTNVTKFRHVRTPTIQLVTCKLSMQRASHTPAYTCRFYSASLLLNDMSFFSAASVYMRQVITLWFSKTV